VLLRKVTYSSIRDTIQLDVFHEFRSDNDSFPLLQMLLYHLEIHTPNLPNFNATLNVFPQKEKTKSKILLVKLTHILYHISQTPDYSLLSSSVFGRTRLGALREGKKERGP
jgi:hypothetical protein